MIGTPYSRLQIKDMCCCPAPQVNIYLCIISKSGVRQTSERHNSAWMRATDARQKRSLSGIPAKHDKDGILKVSLLPSLVSTMTIALHRVMKRTVKIPVISCMVRTAHMRLRRRESKDALTARLKYAHANTNGSWQLAYNKWKQSKNMVVMNVINNMPNLT